MKRRVFKRNILYKTYTLCDEVVRQITQAYEEDDDFYELTVLFSIGLADYYSSAYTKGIHCFKRELKEQLDNFGIKYSLEDELMPICHKIRVYFERDFEGFSANEIVIKRLIKNTTDDDVIEELNTLLIQLKSHPEKADKIIRTAKSIMEDYR